MRSSWLTNITVAVVIGLLTLFVALQFRWLDSASDAQLDRMRKRVEIDTKNFADDFNREIQGAYFNFQADPEPIEQGDAAELAERYEYWRQNASFPELISEIVYVSNKPEPNPRRYDPAGRTLRPATGDEKLAAVARKITAEKSPAPLIDEDYALVVPVHEPEKRVDRIVFRRTPKAEKPIVEMPAAAGYFVVFLNEKVLKEQMLTAFSLRHFPSNDFSIAVTNSRGEAVYQTASVSASDSSAALFDLMPDNLIFFANRETLPRKNESDDDVVVNRRIENRTIEEELGSAAEGGKTFTIQMQDNGGKKRTSIVSSTASGAEPWKLNVQHTAGSIEAFVEGERNKSFLIGVGIYALLVASIMTIVISANRAKAFARRQIDFVSSVSHEFRTPLAVIYSAGENLADGVAKDEEQVSRYGNLIKGEGRKLTGMVEQILEFAGARSGKKKYNFVKTDVAGLVRKAIADCRPHIEKDGFIIEENIGDQLPPIEADAEAVETALRNLIQNAVKYSNGSRWLRVAAENGNGRIKISVEDRGIGIAAADRKKIFEPFYRAKSVVDAQIHGNGLGLSLVKEIAEAHGGNVEVTSDEEKGSKFTIELPSEPPA